MEKEGNSLATTSVKEKKKVCYYYDPEVGDYYYGEDHYMKPQRIRMTHDLIDRYGLLPKLQLCKPLAALDEHFLVFHSKEYVDLIRKNTSKIEGKKNKDHFLKFNLSEGGDCPMFDGIYTFCQTYVGGSIGGATRLNFGESDIAINWAGGLHHAHKDKAAGFCYVNDIVLAILELLKFHQRVLYVDIDVHHGDGVEEAFYTSDRVMTVSFHKYGNIFVKDKVESYFPGTGHQDHIGSEEGRGYSVNVPLDDGIDDDTYWTMFKPIIDKVMEVFNPHVVVLQCGADSLAGDMLGPFNLTIKGHGRCVNYIRSFNKPLLLLGGGGYTIQNVARCWCYETGIALGEEIEGKIPEGVYPDYYAPEYNLHIAPSNKVNRNTSSQCRKIVTEVYKHLSKIPAVPSVQFQERPPGIEFPEVGGKA